MSVIFLVTFTYGQDGQKGFGFDVGFATSKSLMAAIKYFDGLNAFSLGFSYQSNHELGKRATKRLVDTIIGNGHYFYTVDIGYTRILNDQFSVEGEISIGPKKFYTNFTNNSFAAGGYHVIDKTNTQLGVGGILIYQFNDIFGLYAGYNTIRQANLGLQINLVKKE